jgi:hypothetical protein
MRIVRETEGWMEFNIRSAGLRTHVTYLYESKCDTLEELHNSFHKAYILPINTRIATERP